LPSVAVTHKTVQNTFSRLAGFLFTNPDALARSRLLSTRTQLQFNQQNEGSDLYSDATFKFNNGIPGIPVPHSARSEMDNSILTTRSIDVNFTPIGKLTSKKAFRLFKETQRLYAKCRNNWEASGIHSNDFWPFCFGKVDVLVFHNWIQSIGDPELTQFAKEGTKIANGLDTGTTSSGSSSSSTSSSNRRSSSSSNLHQQNIQELLDEMKILP
jgi:hypothetical protein